MSSSDSHSLTYESIVESFVVHRKSFQCDYEKCDKSFSTQSRLNAHKGHRHAIDGHKEVITREPIASGSDVVIASGQQSTSSPMTGAFSPDTRSVDNKHDLGSDVEDVILTHEYSAGKAPDGTNSAPVVSGQPLPDTDSVIMQCFNNNANTSQTPAPGALPHDHEMAAHNSPDRHYSSTGCADPTVLSKSARRHMNRALLDRTNAAVRHRNLRHKPCDLCGKRFRTDTGVETHKQRFHTNGGPTDCPPPDTSGAPNTDCIPVASDAQPPQLIRGPDFDTQITGNNANTIQPSISGAEPPPHSSTPGPSLQSPSHQTPYGFAQQFGQQYTGIGHQMAEYNSQCFTVGPSGLQSADVYVHHSTTGAADLTRHPFPNTGSNIRPYFNYTTITEQMTTSSIAEVPPHPTPGPTQQLAPYHNPYTGPIGQQSTQYYTQYDHQINAQTNGEFTVCPTAGSTVQLTGNQWPTVEMIGGQHPKPNGNLRHLSRRMRAKLKRAISECPELAATVPHVKCDLCGKWFITQMDVEDHKLAVHPNPSN
ncbi:unnamed protein product [Medioppia subpectinata]|uniref:C2H2-type domain-containing protein n=1 Tax=Medioppia subpectinata TaxID=1979941 RepID=A0A7R9L232_9ACAR|nr:unnamed protein product [Medioppia subpectinata]CAG2114072.1 unnamed protein product [Medioppia subpectinata]